MNRYPSHVYAALASMGPPDEEVDAFLKAFIARRGSLEMPGLLRAIDDSGEFDRLFAIWALGATYSAEAREVLRPLLASAQPLERWASALALADCYQERRTLPALCQMLIELLPPRIDDHPVAFLDIVMRASEYYLQWRPRIPIVLGDWGAVSSVPALRSSLQSALRIERRV